MATITEKQADLTTLLDDIASTLAGLSNWSDADSYVTNDGSTDDWHNNGRVLADDNTGMFLCMFISTSEHYNQRSYHSSSREASGIRFVVSNDWDSTNHHPAGKTNVNSLDPFSGEVGNHRKQSYSSFNVDSRRTTYDKYKVSGIWPYQTHLGGNRSEHRTASVTYYMAADVDHFTVGAWNTTDGSNGHACVATWEYLNQKFWNDSTEPLALFTATGHGNIAIYGFQSLGHEETGTNNHTNRNSSFGGAAWGIINPDSNDDTFFFRRATVYQTNSRTVPVSYLYSVIKNDEQEGGAHGDLITFDGTDYRIMQQSGASSNETISMGLKFQ